MRSYPGVTLTHPVRGAGSLYPRVLPKSLRDEGAKVTLHSLKTASILAFASRLSKNFVAPAWNIEQQLGKPGIAITNYFLEIF
jgi:hypothetical protein